jgi:hypothetical protein
MSTKDIHESHEPAPPLGLGLSEGLGPLPERAAVCAHRRYTLDVREQTGRCIDCGAEGRMRFVVGDPVAAERERLKADAEQWGNALNAAGWEATAAYRRHTGQVEPPIFFNHAKGIVRDALAAYFRSLKA